MLNRTHWGRKFFICPYILVIPQLLAYRVIHNSFYNSVKTSLLSTHCCHLISQTLAFAHQTSILKLQELRRRYSYFFLFSWSSFFFLNYKFNQRVDQRKFNYSLTILFSSRLLTTMKLFDFHNTCVCLSFLWTHLSWPSLLLHSFPVFLPTVWVLK